MMELGRSAQNDQWLILTDFASKYKISVSTLRRRIKTNQIKHKFEGGRYMLADEAPIEVMHGSGGVGTLGSSSGMMQHEHRVHVPHFAPIMNQAAPISATPQSIAAEGKLKEFGEQGGEQAEGPILATATRLLNELKRAYSNILQEKEEQLLHLREEVVDLKTLVRVLESDNDRMRAILQKWGTA
jgi:hypothetical protein